MSVATDDNAYVIPQEVLDKYPDIIDMLKKSKSIDDEEKKYWFGALETMDEEQVASLRQILEDEIEQIEKVEEEYTDESQKAIDEAEIEMIEKKREEERQKRIHAERQSKEEEEDRKEELLRSLEDL